MEQPDFWANAGVLIAAAVAALAGYYGPRVFGKSPPAKVDPVLSGIALALGDKEQSERIIATLERIARALEAIADKRQNDMQETLEELVASIKPRRPRT